MFPHEAQATMAKILFLLFATALLCMTEGRASEVQTSMAGQSSVCRIASH